MKLVGMVRLKPSKLYSTWAPTLHSRTNSIGPLSPLLGNMDRKTSWICSRKKNKYRVTKRCQYGHWQGEVSRASSQKHSRLERMTLWSENHALAILHYI